MIAKSERDRSLPAAVTLCSMFSPAAFPGLDAGFWLLVISTQITSAMN